MKDNLEFKRKLSSAEQRLNEEDQDEGYSLETTVERNRKRLTREGAEFEMEEYRIALEENEEQFTELVNKIIEYFVITKGDIAERENYKAMEQRVREERLTVSKMKEENLKLEKQAI